MEATAADGGGCWWRTMPCGASTASHTVLALLLGDACTDSLRRRHPLSRYRRPCCGAGPPGLRPHAASVHSDSCHNSYRLERYYWESVVMARKLCIAAIGIYSVARR
jgi:hypothetical protein